MKEEAAFPNYTMVHSHMEGPHPVSGGLTKRELFAAMAMQGILYAPNFTEPDTAAKHAVECANSLIAELEKKDA